MSRSFTPEAEMESAPQGAARSNQDLISVVHVGLGPIGRQVARLVRDRSSLRSIGAIDVDPDLVGRGLGEVIEAVDGRSDVKIVSDLSQLEPANGRRVAVHCAGSSLAKAAPLLTELIAAGYHVVSTCEELADPWSTQPELARKLDQIARTHEVALLGTGVNPGYAMDYLPIVLAGSQHAVRRVSVHRVQDAAIRRLPLQRKVGAGLTVERFQELVAAGTIRHVGLPESAMLVDRALALGCNTFSETIEPVVASEPVTLAGGLIPAGHVLGIDQQVIGLRDEVEVIRLHLQMAVGLPDARDEIVLEGEPGLRTVIHGLHGDDATAAVVVNSFGRVLVASAGLRTVAEIPAAPLLVNGVACAKHA